MPLLLDGVAWLDSRTDDLCGYDVLVTALARIGGPGTPRVRGAAARLAP